MTRPAANGQGWETLEAERAGCADVVLWDPVSPAATRWSVRSDTPTEGVCSSNSRKFSVVDPSYRCPQPCGGSNQACWPAPPGELQRGTDVFPPQRRAEVPAGRLAAWMDAAGGRCGLSDARNSLVLPRDRLRALTLVRIAPGRGPGGAELVARVAAAARSAPNAAGDDRVEHVTLLSADRPGALDAPAAALAQLFELALGSEDSCDV